MMTKFKLSLMMLLQYMMYAVWWVPLCLFLAMLAYMPSWSLTSAIAMAHLPSEDFPKIRVFGSIGWVASGIFSVIFIRFLGIDFDGTHIPFFCGAGVSFIASFSSLALPHTSPLLKGKKATLIDAFGLGTVKLMKDRNFKFTVVR